MTKNIKIGDWIRFQHEGSLVIDEVAYHGTTNLGHPILITQRHASVYPDKVLEHRPGRTYYVEGRTIYE